jgi:hypothetical protein
VVTSNQASTTSRVAVALATLTTNGERRQASHAVRLIAAISITSNPTQASR